MLCPINQISSNPFTYECEECGSSRTVVVTSSTPMQTGPCPDGPGCFEPGPGIGQAMAVFVTRTIRAEGLAVLGPGPEIHESEGRVEVIDTEEYAIPGTGRRVRSYTVRCHRRGGGHNEHVIGFEVPGGAEGLPHAEVVHGQEEHVIVLRRPGSDRAFGVVLAREA